MFDVNKDKHANLSFIPENFSLNKLVSVLYCNVIHFCESKNDDDKAKEKSGMK